MSRKHALTGNQLLHKYTLEIGESHEEKRLYVGLSRFIYVCMYVYCIGESRRKLRLVFLPPRKEKECQKTHVETV